jgi:hypothetical protein
MRAQLDEEFRDFMHGRWPAMVRRGKAIKGRRRVAAAVAVAAVVAVGVITVPSLHRLARANRARAGRPQATRRSISPVPPWRTR